MFLQLTVYGRAKLILKIRRTYLTPDLSKDRSLR